MQTAESKSTSLEQTVMPATGETQPVDIPEIQQASWRVEVPVPPAVQASLVQQTDKTVRDDAPSPLVVVGCLVGFGLLSLALFFQSMPHYWFHRHQFNNRLKGR